MKVVIPDVRVLVALSERGILEDALTKVSGLATTDVVEHQLVWPPIAAPDSWGHLPYGVGQRIRAALKARRGPYEVLRSSFGDLLERAWTEPSVLPEDYPELGIYSALSRLKISGPTIVVLDEAFLAANSVRPMVGARVMSTSEFALWLRAQPDLRVSEEELAEHFDFLIESVLPHEGAIGVTRCGMVVVVLVHPREFERLAR